MKAIKDNFKFLKGDTKIHPTTGITLEYLVKQDAICVAVFDNNLENIYLVSQYRPGADKKLLEIVAGLIEKGESPLEACYREFNEETGFLKTDIEKIISLKNPQYVSPGYSTEKLYFYAIKLKKGAVPKKQHLDFGEDLDLVKLPINQALEIALDMKTIFSIKYFLGELK